MTAKTSSHWLSDLPKRQRAMTDLITILQNDPELAGIKVKEVLKLAPGRQVFLVRINGEKAVLKRFLGGKGPAPEAIVENLARELGTLAPTMSDGPYQINRCILARPDFGFVVLSFAKGKRITDVLSLSGHQKRARLMRESGNWLATYTKDRQKLGHFGPRYWLQRRLSADTARMSSTDQTLLAALGSALDRWSDKLKGCSVTQASIHGDFSGLNLHIQGGTLTGIDVQGECRQPIARDAARFLVWQQIHDQTALPAQNFGVNAADWQAFLSSGVLPKNEWDTTLPFFVGDRLYDYLVLDHAKDPAADRIRTAIRCFLSQSP